MPVSALLLQSSGNQLSAFQAGLSAIPTIAADQQLVHPAPPPTTKPGG
jgi:hypothetical protein